MKKNSPQRLRNKKNRARKQGSHSGLRLEFLESRDLLAVDAFVVDTAIDENDGVGVGTGTSLREAVIAANADPDLTTISFDSALDGTPIAVTVGQLTVNSTVVINGNGAANTIIESNGGNVLRTGGDLTLNDLKLTGGTGSGGAGVYNFDKLTVNRSTISGNSSGIVSQYAQSLTVTDSTISGNSSSGIFIESYFGTATNTTIKNTTITGNSRGVNAFTYYGGGGGVTISNSTISGNSNSGVRTNDEGYGIAPVVTLQSTIVGDNGSDLVNNAGTINASFSLIENNFGQINGTNVSNITGVDPQLDPGGLQDNGGPTETINLQATSPAIDAGSNPESLVNDQRGAGFPREDGGTADIGAIEFTVAGDTTPPVLTAFARENPVTENTDADTLVFRALFDEDVQNVDATDFAVDGITTATVTAVSQVNASTYDVTVSGGDLAGFNGTVGLNLDAGQNIEDLAGNVLPAGEPAVDETFTVANALTAQELLEELIEDVGDLALNGGNTNALIKKLNSAIDKLDGGLITAGVNTINSFINQVNAFVNSGKLTQAQADALIDPANAAIAAAGEGGAALVTHTSSGGSSSAVAQPISEAALLVTDTLSLALDDGDGSLGAEHQARLQDAISELNDKLGVYGIALIALDAQSTEQPDITITVSSNSACGDATDGVLGCTEQAGEITLISGWSWYAGADSGAIGADQYDFQTIVTHEVGHSVGLDHSGDAYSVMFELLATDETRRALTAQDLVLLEAEAAEGPAALRAAPGHNAKLGQDAAGSAVAAVENSVGRTPEAMAAGSSLFAADSSAARGSSRQNVRSLGRPAEDGIRMFGNGNPDAAHLRASEGRRSDTRWRDDFLAGAGVDDLSFGGRDHDDAIQQITRDRGADGEQKSQSPFGESADSQLVDRCLEELLNDEILN